MAKKNTPSDHTNSSTGATPERRRAPRTTSRRTAAPVDAAVESGAVAAAPADTANDRQRSGNGEADAAAPTYDQIAEAAYHRYLQRGGQHGGDFDDWVEAERTLRVRR